MRTSILLILLAVTGVAAEAPGGPAVAAPTAQAIPAAPRSPGFDVSLSIPDHFSAVQGAIACADLWRKTILATATSIVVVGGEVPEAWIEPLVRLREQRPEVAVEVLLDRGMLGGDGRFGDVLHAAGIRVRFSSGLASMAGWPNEPALRSLLLVRDRRQLLMVSGIDLDSDRETLIQAWLLDCPPAAAAYAARLDTLARRLPPYPEAKQILISDTLP